MKLRIYITILLVFFASSVFSAPSLLGKKISFFTDDRTGNFYVENPNPPNRSLKELLFKDVPPTSYITLILNGKTYNLDDSKLGTSKTQDLGNDVQRFYYRAENQQVTVTYIITNMGGGENDSIIAGISIKNAGTATASCGARFLLDTVYDEPSRKIQLYFPSGEKIEYDRLLPSDMMPAYVYSGPFDPDKPNAGGGLYIYPAINTFRPDSLIIGNWKKLDEKQLSYVVEPQAKFKYNPYSNPDAAVAVIYKNISIKPNEEITFGIVLSTSKFEIKNISLIEPVIAAPVVQPVLPAAAATNTNQIVLPRAPVPETVPVLTAGTNDLSLLKAQLQLLEKATQLLDRIGNYMQNSNQTNLAPAETSSLGQGLGNAVGKGTSGDPFESAQTNAPAAAPVKKTVQETPVYPVYTNVPGIPAPQITYTNIIYNTVNSTDQKEAEAVKADMSRLQKQYEDKILSLQDYYQKLMKQQEDQFKSISSDYKKQADAKEQKKNKTQQLDEVNSTIIRLDQQIQVIEKLMDLNVDFENLPPEKLEEIQQAIQDLDQKIQ